MQFIESEPNSMKVQGPPVASGSKKVMMVSITLTESPQGWYCDLSLFLIHIIIH